MLTSASLPLLVFTLKSVPSKVFFVLTEEPLVASSALKDGSLTRMFFAVASSIFSSEVMYSVPFSTLVEICSYKF
jgi:hypothetical protein